MLRSALLGCLMISLLACGGEEPLGLSSAAIVNGEPFYGYQQVGMLYCGEVFCCTATLVGRQTVLTAAHCIDTGGVHAPLKSFRLYIDGAWKSYPVASAAAHPWYNQQTLNYDIGVVRLATAPDVLPLPISNFVPQKGTELTLVGAGLTAATSNDAEQMRRAKNTIREVGSLKIHLDAISSGTGSICFGDSGGPSIAWVDGGDRAVLVGVHSYGDGGDCGSSEFDARVDVMYEWVRDAAAGDVSFFDVSSLTIDAPMGAPGPEDPTDPGQAGRELVGGCAVSAVGSAPALLPLLLFALIGRLIRRSRRAL